MEWYFGNEEDLVVPKDRERLLDRLPSPDNWSQWGVSKFESADAPRKHLCGNSFYEGGLRDEYQLSDVAGTDQMDDMLLSSMLEQDTSSTYDNLHGSSSFSADPNYNMMMSVGNNFMLNIMEEMDYLNTGSEFLPSVDWENGDVATTSCLHVSRDRYVEEEKSPEESVLQDLERVTSQLTEQTRSCFRDALYRLAENSRQQYVDLNQNGGYMEEDDDDLAMDDSENLRSRLGKTEATESKTNAIDRAIANLMFKKMEYFGVEDLSATSSANMEQEQDNAVEANNMQLNYIQSCTISSDEAEVPTFNQHNQHRDFSGVAAFANVLSYC